MSSKYIMVPLSKSFLRPSKNFVSMFSNWYCCGVKSSTIALSRPLLSIMPPTKSVLAVFVIIWIRFAQESNANFPIPFRPIYGLPELVFVSPSFRFEYPIFKNLFWKSSSVIPWPSSLIVRELASLFTYIHTLGASASHAFEIASPSTVIKFRYKLRPKWFKTLSEMLNVKDEFISGILLDVFLYSHQ